MNENEVALTFELPHPPEKVWRALTEPALLERWLAKTDMQPTPGRRFQFQWEPADWNDGVIDCEILEVNRPRFLSYTWRARGLDTVLNWTLEPTATGTLLKLEQTGFKCAPRGSSAGARAGWNEMAGRKLAKLLDEMD